MRSPCQLQEPGPSHCQIAAKGPGRVPPRVIPVQAGEGCSPLLWQPFLFKGDLLKISQSRGRVRGGGREVPVETTAGKAPSTLSSTGRAEGMSCAGRPPTPCLPLQGCCPHASQSHTEAQTGCAAHRPSHHPSVLQKRNRLGKGASWTPGFQENANLLQRLLGGGPGWPQLRVE